MSSFGANSTIKMLKIWNIKMLKNWNKSSEGLPRWSAGAGKKSHDEARQAVEQVNQRGFAITVLGVKTSQLDRALSNWDWSQCWPCPELEVGLRPPGVPFNMNDLLTPLFKIHQWEWECTILIQQSKLFFWVVDTTFLFSINPPPQTFWSCSLICCKVEDEQEPSWHVPLFITLYSWLGNTMLSAKVIHTSQVKTSQFHVSNFHLQSSGWIRSGVWFNVFSHFLDW